MKEMDIVEVYEFLRVNAYILARGQDKILSKKFMEDLESAKKSLKQPLMRIVLPEAKLQPITNWPEAFIRFIVAANVPRVIENNGKTFDANKYSDSAMKEFQRMILKERIDLDYLIKSTTLYYASSKDFKKKIGNYILDGDWRTDYLDLINAAESGESALKDHINREIDGNEHNIWT